MAHIVDKSDGGKNSDSKGLHTSENGSPLGLHAPDPSTPLSPPPHYCLTSYRPALLNSAPCGEEDQRSLTSQDSGIPTLEISPPEASEDSPATLTLEPAHGGLPRATALPRGGSERHRSAGVRPLSGGAGTFNRSDDISVCSVSSLSTELSTTLSLGNDDGADFIITSDSSAVVTFENDVTIGSRFTEIPLPPPNNLLQHHWSPQRQTVAMSTPQDVQLRRSPILSFLSRNLFSKKGKEVEGLESHRESGWKMFGRALSTRELRRLENEKGGRAGEGSSPSQSVRKNLEFEPLSTTALILEHRPANLPAKSAEEAEKHKQQYEEMVVQARKRELKEAQKRRKQFEDRVKLEESIGNAALIWNQEILPNWHTMHSSRRVRELWWQGVPPSVRGRVWSVAIANDLNITHELFTICLARAKEKWNSAGAPAADLGATDTGLLNADREASLELIKLDISRTFPSLCIFQQGGPYHDVLHSVLGAYTCYRPDVGYVQGMSFIAAVLILNMDTADAFIAFANLLNKPCHMAFYRVDHSLMQTYFTAFEVFFEENLPKLFAHFKSNSLTPDIYLIDWIFTLYSKSLPLDLACRVWDVFCRDGEEFLFRTALGLLRLYDDVLTRMDFIHIAQFLTRLPEHVPADALFSCITTINMTCRNKKWAQVLQALQKEPERASPVLKH